MGEAEKQRWAGLIAAGCLPHSSDGSDFFHPAVKGVADNSYAQTGYGKVFTLDPRTLMKIWVPFFVGIWGLVEQVAPFTPGYVQSMARSMAWHTIVMLYICFPCAGNWGILSGFFCLAQATFCLIGIFCCKGECANFGRTQIALYAKLGSKPPSDRFTRGVPRSRCVYVCELIL